MANTNTQNVKKTKLLDQMLEDLAGDEFDEFDVNQAELESSSHRYNADDSMFDLDNLH